MHGDRLIARVLKTGAMVSGGFFLASLALELLPNRESTAIAIDCCGEPRKATPPRRTPQVM